MKAVVFGGSGFVGSHVADCLTGAGHGVTIFDHQPSPYLLPGQELIVGDILDQRAVSGAVAGCDCVYNFAGIADLDDATARPLTTVEQNVMGAAVLLEAALKAGAQRFVQASTIYVYSDKGGFYRCSKQAAELYVEEYQRRFGLSYTILRYGTLYGPRADSRNSIYRYIRQALQDGRVVCAGTGEEIREYIHVRDAAHLSVTTLGDEYRNQQVTITGHHPMRLKDMLQMVREILGNRVEIEFSGGELNPAHYSTTPYSFGPKTGRKLVTNHYVDMGQGLLQCINEIYGENLTGKA